MSTDPSRSLSRQITSARRKVEALRRKARSPRAAPRLPEGTLEELWTMLEQLHAVEEERLRALCTLDEERGRYLELFELAPDAYLETDGAGVVQRANRTTGDLLRVSPVHLIGKPMAVCLDRPGRLALDAKLQALAGGATRLEWETVTLPRGQAPLPVSVSVVASRDKDGALANARWLLRDVAAQKRAQEAILRLNETLEARVEERTAAVAAINRALEEEVAGRRGAELRLRRIVELGPDGIVIVDARGRISFANARAAALFGYDAADLQGLPLEQIVPLGADPSAPGQPRLGLADVPPLTNGRALDLCGRRSDGGSVAVEVSIAPLETPDGPRVIASIRDATERKQSEQERKLVRDLALVVTTAPDFHTALYGTLEMICTVAGWERGQVWLPDAGGLAQELQWRRGRGAAPASPRRTPLATIAEATARSARERRRPRWWSELDSGDAPPPTRNGARARRAPFEEVLGIPVPASPGIAAVLVFLLRRVSEDDRRTARLIEAAVEPLGIALEHRRAQEALRENEERLRVALLSSPVVLWRQDQRLRYTWVHNPALPRSAADFVGRTDRDLYPPRDAARLSRLKRRVLETGRGIREEVAFPQEGTIRHYDLTVEPLRDSAGKITGITCAAVEITRLRNAEAALRQAHADLERKVEERTKELQESRELLRALAARMEAIREEERARIAREIHDELGQTLTGVKLDVASLRRELSRSTHAADRGAMAEKLTETLHRLDESIHTVRRIATELRPGVLDELGLAAAIEWQARKFQDRTRVQVEAHLAADDAHLPPEVAVALFRIFQEVLTNVARHARARRVTIRLASESDEIRLEVLDDGRGIQPSEANGARSLGLLGMRERALLHGGEVEIRRGPRKGTAVRVRIPLGEGR